MTYRCEEVGRFVNLDMIITRKLGYSEETVPRTMSENRSLFALNQVLQSESVSRKLTR